MPGKLGTLIPDRIQSDGSGRAGTSAEDLRTDPEQLGRSMPGTDPNRSRGAQELRSISDSRSSPAELLRFLFQILARCAQDAQRAPQRPPNLAGTF